MREVKEVEGTGSEIPTDLFVASCCNEFQRFKVEFSGLDFEESEFCFEDWL